MKTSVIHVFSCLLVLTLWLGAGGRAAADVIHESAVLGPTGVVFGVSLSTGQYVGSRFHLDSPVQVEQIGGHLVGTGTLFGAIVSLSGHGALPSGNPFDGTTVASTVFNAGFPSTDFRTPLSVQLPPGDYALIFGSGQFGATGNGFMLNNNTDIPGQASYIISNSLNWSNSPFSNMRFVVEGAVGTVIPEPSTLTLLALGTAGLLGYGWRRRRRGRA